MPDMRLEPPDQLPVSEAPGLNGIGGRGIGMGRLDCRHGDSAADCTESLRPAIHQA